MCGIIGYVGAADAAPILIDGLQRLEYRGYDSAGLGVIHDNQLNIFKVKGKVAELSAVLPPVLEGHLGIGHTRWATHGEPSIANAHPHVDSDNRIAVVHNGIIENAASLRAELLSEGIVFASQTDTEVLAHLVARDHDGDLGKSIHRALSRVEGTYGIAVIDRDDPTTIITARKGSPLVIGIGDHGHYIASDVAAFAHRTQRVIYLDEGELAVVQADRLDTVGVLVRPKANRVVAVTWDRGRYEKGSYQHFMRKEIHEQTTAIARSFEGRLDHANSTAQLQIELTPKALAEVKAVKFLGCGTAYYAGMSGADLLERMARIPASAESASEFRYRDPVIDPSTLYVVLSQSGETLDTLRAVEEIRQHGAHVLGIINTVESSIARAVDSCLYLNAGPEVSVASTKCFTSTIAVIALLALHLARARGLSASEGDRLCAGFEGLPDLIEETLRKEDHIIDVAERYASVQSALFIGRVAGYPIALEGSQKLKEISYIHAEAYPCSELKHGPLALISELMPTFAIVPNDPLYDKNISTLGEVRARRGPIVAIGHTSDLKDYAEEVVVVPKSELELDPIVLSIPLQLLAYHAAVHLGLDVDQPRNLAKSVTVE